ncbi:hypothetical protein CF112_12910 [Aeromonas hydrophila]|nr:hypothetical protein CF112_12910 [Aeromonas hydrophila]
MTRRKMAAEKSGCAAATWRLHIMTKGIRSLPWRRRGRGPCRRGMSACGPGGLAGWGELLLAFLARASLAAKASSKGVVRASMACLLLQPMGWPQ